MEIIIGPQIIGSYKRLSYKAWYALAEFVDNSTQAYFENKKVLDDTFSKTGETLKVEFEYKSSNGDSYLIIKDNSIGMNENELENALIIGKPPVNDSGRSKYGLGLKTAACWFGDYWEIKTKKLGEKKEHRITVDVQKVVAGERDLSHSENDEVAIEDHYTIITIKSLHRNLVGNTIFKIKNYLRSMYRIDIRDINLNLNWNGDLLKWVCVVE